MVIICFFFFFQAEDGIRDYKVTGVQTCALPIWFPERHNITRSETAEAPQYLISVLVADVYELAGSFRELGDTIARKAGQTQARGQVLSAASAGGKTVPQIARRLGYARQSVQRVVDILGEMQLRKLTAAADRTHRQLARRLDRNDLAIALRVLRTLRARTITGTSPPVPGTACRSM